MDSSLHEDREDGSQLDPRIERSRRVIQEAALEELASAGYGAFTIESVATRSGVARSTIYRHWDDKLALIADALETLNVQPGQPGASGAASGAARVEEILEHLCDVWGHALFAGLLPALIEGSHRSQAIASFLHDYSARRRRGLREAIQAGIDTGTFRGDADAELASVALAGAILYQNLMTEAPFPPDRVLELVELVLGRGPDG